MTHRYFVYGAGLHSTMPFPELQEARDIAASWDFSAVGQLPPMRDAIELGADNIYGDVHARLFRHADGHRITVDDTGDFDLAEGGRCLQWQRREESWPDFVRAHLLGRVLATAMFHEGWLPLHGSAVVLQEGAVAFLAPKGFGKSSLALALTQLGARLLTDDTLPVQPVGPSGEPLAWPGVHSLRVHDDAVEALGADVHGHATREGKLLVTGIPADRRASLPVPLRAVYLLDPRLPGSGAEVAATRTRLPALQAAVGIVAHVKIGRMLGPSGAAAMLTRSAAVTRSVPVYRLSATRDLALLETVAATVMAWHGGPA